MATTFRLKRKLSDPVILYHNAPLSLVPKIRREGIRPVDLDPNSLTSRELSGKGVSLEKQKGLIYLGNKLMASGCGAYRKKHYGYPDEGYTFKISIPLKEYEKLEEVQNPECLGAQTESEYLKIRHSLGDTDDREIKQRWKTINPPWTITIRGSISPEWIVN